MTSTLNTGTLPADRPIRVGIIGLSASRGWAATAHVPALRAVEGYELRALAASSPERAKTAAEAHDVTLAFATPHELAGCDEVDLVVVTVRVPEHRELVSAAIDAGKAVLCEWPLARNLAEAKDLTAAAHAKGLRTAVGLQARSAPLIRHLVDLVADGYVGEVLSTTLVASGGLWGAVIPNAGARYLFDRSTGATMLTIPFGHTIDALALVLGEPTGLEARLATRRDTVLDAESSGQVPTTAADQIAVTGVLPNGAVLSIHYRGGQSRASNLRWEINGTDGDLLVEGAGNSVQTRPLSLSGGRGSDREIAPIEVPAGYHKVPALDDERTAPAYNVAHQYVQLREDVLGGTQLVPDFEHATRRHETLQAILDSAGEPWGTEGA